MKSSLIQTGGKLGKIVADWAMLYGKGGITKKKEAKPQGTE